MITYIFELKSCQMTNSNPGPVYNHENYRLFIGQLREKEDKELDKIITRYALYKPEMADAALFTAVERGLISYELKEKLAEQIKFNLSDVPDYRKQKSWEKNNSFAEYAARYSDEELYEIIDNPSDRIIDAYHGVLVAALSRELISEEDFGDLFNNALKSLRSEGDIYREETDNFLRDILLEKVEITDEQAEAESARYWKCPNCGENIDMEFAVCWKCNTAIPDNPEHPGREEVKKELLYRSPAKPARIGLALLLLGLIIMGVSWLGFHIHLGYWRHRYSDIFLGGIIAVAGVIILIYHLFTYKRE